MQNFTSINSKRINSYKLFKNFRFTNSNQKISPYVVLSISSKSTFIFGKKFHFYKSQSKNIHASFYFTPNHKKLTHKCFSRFAQYKSTPFQSSITPFSVPLPKNQNQPFHMQKTDRSLALFPAELSHRAPRRRFWPFQFAYFHSRSPFCLLLLSSSVKVLGVLVAGRRFCELIFWVVGVHLVF
jgi:hypothetical protein